MKKIVLCTALAASIVFSAPTLAADASRFDGFYAGVFVGLGSVAYEGQTDTSEIDDGYPEEAEIFSGDYDSGFVGGGYAGINMVSGDIIYGLEAALTVGNIQAYTEDEGTNDSATQDLASLITLSGRLGYAVSDSTLLYGGAGLGLLTSNFHAYNDQDDVDDAEDGSAFYTQAGIVIAAGVEQAITESISLRAEASYFQPFGQHDFEADELTSDMDDGDYGAATGVFRLTAGVTFGF